MQSHEEEGVSDSGRKRDAGEISTSSDGSSMTKIARSNLEAIPSENRQFPILDFDRERAILRGVVPVFDPALSQAYGDAVRMLSSGVSILGSQEDLRTIELCHLLKTTASDGNIRKLALYMLSNLAKAAMSGSREAKNALERCLEFGALLETFKILAYTTQMMAAEHTSAENQEKALEIVKIATQFVRATCSVELLPAGVTHPIQTGSQLRYLAAATVNMATYLVNRNHKSDHELISIHHQIMSHLLLVHFSIQEHEGCPEGICEESYVLEFKSSKYAEWCFDVLKHHHAKEITSVISTSLKKGANYPGFRDTMLGVDGLKIVVDLLSSTVHDDPTVCNLLIFLSNCVTYSDNHAANLVEADALTYLQPSVLHSDSSIAVQACFAISCLALSPSSTGVVEKSGAFRVIEDVLRSITPGSRQIIKVWHLGGNLRASINLLCAMMGTDAHPCQHLTCLHEVAATLWIKKNVEIFGNSQEFIRALRICAASNDPFVFSASAYVLRTLSLPVPSFRPTTVEATLSAKDCGAWSIDQVCTWVASQNFKTYRKYFRENLVSGRVLLSLSEGDLVNLGVTNALHRRAIVFAIEDLKEASTLDTVEDSSGFPTSLKPIAQTFDVFISYRRVGGADFAHLLKLCLSAMGLEVFLDVENLGQGKFDDKLVSSLQHSNNVLLVWTKGCMDRFLDGGDPLNGDFVRIEYALALRHRKNIVPVYKEDFVFPTESQLPDDVKPILSYNAIKFIGEYRDASIDKIKKSLIVRTN